MTDKAALREALLNTHPIPGADELGRVAVLMGGVSAERDVSLMSGQGVLSALQDAGVNVVPIDVNENLVSQLAEAKVDRVFNILHGGIGENGAISALLELMDIPYTGSSMAASALAMDKWRSKKLWIADNLPVKPGVLIEDKFDEAALLSRFSLPLCVKPTLEGSSVGVTCVRNKEDLKPAILKAQQYGPAMIEPWVEGSECTVAILGGTALPVVQIVTSADWYDYHAKYISDDTQYLCPAPFLHQLTQYTQEIAVKAYEALGCTGWARVDFMLDKHQQPWLLEVNTVPGMTSHSLVPKAAAAAGLSYQEVVMMILGQTLSSAEDAQRHVA